MSLYVEGLHVALPLFTGAPRTVLSSAFSRSLMGSRNNTRLLFTTVVEPYGPLSFILDCLISSSQDAPDIPAVVLDNGE
ncbi:hypothetical protein DFH09DRAFT_1306174 [Mycena vulgaris]|nr:hypothetical protein DFH09DRAFT_1306174 [Mycena vulgaris]